MGTGQLSVNGSDRKWMLPLGIAIAIGLFLIGSWSVPMAIFGPERALIPGDLGDARFNNYILEHFHAFITGKTPRYWDAPFMYPYKNVIALSDNLLGTAPIYSAFRSIGFNREAAFQLWLLTMFALNYWCCLFAVKKWSGNWILAACAAYIFAFGIYNIGQINNLQVFPKFMAPLAFLLLWRHLSTGSWKYLLLAVLATVYQFYCAIYLGFILSYALFFLLVGHAIAYRAPSYLQRFRSKTFVLGWAVSIGIGLLLLAPLMLPYMDVAHDLGTRKFAEVSETIPRPTSYFFTHPAALSWRSLSQVGVDAFPQWWSHLHFIGAIPWIALLAAPFLFFSKRAGIADRKLLLGIGTALLLSTLFCLNLGGYSLYALVFEIPGFSAMRAIDRYINVQVLFFLFLFAAVLAPLFRKRWAALALSIVLPFLVVQENRWEVARLKRFDKHDARDLVTDIERRILREYKAGAAYDAISYQPPLAIMSEADGHFRTITTQLSAMLAAQALSIPIVNAYTGSYPGNYIAFFDHMDHRTLADWCEFNGITTDRIQEIHGLALPVSRMDVVQIKAANGEFVSADELKEGTAIADRTNAAEWETFRRVQTADGRYAFLCHSGHYLCAEQESGERIMATAMDVGDFGLFTLELLDSNQVAIKAFNGRYVTLDPDTKLLSATADSIRADARFEMIVTGENP